MSDPNTTPPPYRGGPGAEAAPPGTPPPAGPPTFGAPPVGPPPPGQFPPGPPPPGQFPHHPQTPLQTPAQAYSQWAHVEGWVPELGVRIAPAGARIGAKAIDIALYLVIQIIAGLAIAAIWLATGAFDAPTSSGSNVVFGTGTDLVSAIAAGLVLLVIDLLYNVVCTARFGGTPGKLIVGIKVIHQDGRPIDLRGAFIRFSPVLALIVLGMVPIVNFVVSFARLGLLLANLVLVLVDERRKDVFDRVASTYVVTSR